MKRLSGCWREGRNGAAVAVWVNDDGGRHRGGRGHGGGKYRVRSHLED